MWSLPFPPILNTNFYQRNSITLLTFFLVKFWLLNFDLTIRMTSLSVGVYVVYYQFMLLSEQLQESFIGNSGSPKSNSILILLIISSSFIPYAPVNLCLLLPTSTALFLSVFLLSHYHNWEWSCLCNFVFSIIYPSLLTSAVVVSLNLHLEVHL